MLPPRDGIRDVQAQLDRYLEALPFPVEAAVVVGSRARGSHWRGSDLDLVLVSETFSAMPRYRRIERLLEPWKGPPALEPLGFTAYELGRPDSLYLWEALADGRTILDQGVWRDARQRFQERIDRGEIERTSRGWRILVES
ncbi:MAG: nucleotidyltransferase domain-containing protein [Armatimonadetes bacterium]|nr:nucleotidyltransferase domain-containing protein [Armatimonadota bacterium]